MRKPDTDRTARATPRPTHRSGPRHRVIGGTSIPMRDRCSAMPSSASRCDQSVTVPPSLRVVERGARFDPPTVGDPDDPLLFRPGAYREWIASGTIVVGHAVGRVYCDVDEIATVDEVETAEADGDLAVGS